MFPAVVLLWLFVQLCSARDMKCTVTHAGDKTTYDISDLSPDMCNKASPCMFTWSNATDFVIAHHRGLFLQPVMSSSFGTLITSKCIGNVSFTATCEIKQRAYDYTASCTPVCPPEALIDNTGMPPSQIGVIVAAVLLLVGLVCFLCYKYRLWSKCCGQTGGSYPRVMFKKAPEAKADVETGGG
ncbi:immunoglobulin lambda-like polypeptide 1 [Sarotherodon galilaeus]